MRSTKAPPNQKNRGQVLPHRDPTPLNLASKLDKCNAHRGFLGTSGQKHVGEEVICLCLFC